MSHDHAAFCHNLRGGGSRLETLVKGLHRVLVHAGVQVLVIICRKSMNIRDVQVLDPFWGSSRPGVGREEAEPPTRDGIRGPAVSKEGTDILEPLWPLSMRPRVRDFEPLCLIADVAAGAGRVSATQQ